MCVRRPGTAWMLEAQGRGPTSDIPFSGLFYSLFTNF
jgi:hypothetical protein